MDALAARRRFGFLVARINVARDAKTRVVRQHAIETQGSLVSAVGDRDLSGVQRVADADASAVMKRNPTRAARRVEQRIQDGPIGDGVRAVLHSFGLAEG